MDGGAKAPHYEEEIGRRGTGQQDGGNGLVVIEWTQKNRVAPVVSAAWFGDRNPDGGWLVEVKGTGVPGARLQMKKSHAGGGDWQDHGTVPEDGKFSLVSNSYEEEDGCVTMRQIVDGVVSAESAKVPVNTLKSVSQTKEPETVPGGTGTAVVKLESTGVGKTGGKYVLTAPRGFSFANENVEVRRPDGSDAGGTWELSWDGTGEHLTNKGAWWDSKGTWTLTVSLKSDKNAPEGTTTAKGGLSFQQGNLPPVIGDLSATVLRQE
ncbi:hypothetical protein AB8O64_35910 (plasmid) [Streptomyces sp. QH1-20]|uniref:hypothetical protein n=1 Tax=Streptomyces sp. QH1-20 TaxID=3240934 RepID=UPI003515D59C